MGDLIKSYRRYFDLDEAVFSRIDHNDTMVSVTYKVELPSQKPVILKICRRDKDFHRELFFLNELAGCLPVPKIENAKVPDAGQGGAILMEFIEGDLLGNSDWTEKLACEIGEKLALLHSKCTDVYGECSKQTCHTQSVREYFEEKFFEELKECENHLPDKLVQDCKDFYLAHQYLLDSVDGPCMIHRDFRPGNMIAYNGKIAGIIDWASARFGFAEQDFCSIEHCGWPADPLHKQALLEGYSSIRPVPNYQPIMPLLRLGRALAVIGFTVNSRTWDNRDREIYQYNRQFLEKFPISK